MVRVKHRGVRIGEARFPCWNQRFEKGSAVLENATSQTEIVALIADEDEERSYGLSYRGKLPSDKGMAFLWESDVSTSFWMKNTWIPLSIAFFDAEGTIVSIVDMEPCYEDPCPDYEAGRPYRGALEVNQGSFEEWDIEVGDRIHVTAP